MNLFFLHSQWEIFFQQKSWTVGSRIRVPMLGPSVSPWGSGVACRTSSTLLNWSVKLGYGYGYGYRISHGIYFVTTPILIVIFSAQIGKLTWQDLSLIKLDLPNALFLTGLLALILYVYLDLMPRPTYLVDFACYRPPTELKVNQSSFIFFILF